MPAAACCRRQLLQMSLTQLVCAGMSAFTTACVCHLLACVAVRGCVCSLQCLQVVPSRSTAGASDVDGPAAQRESELGCVSRELSEWTAFDHGIQTLTSSSKQQQQEAGQAG